MADEVKKSILIEYKTNVENYKKQIIEATRNLTKLKDEQEKLLKAMEDMDKRTKEYKTMQSRLIDVNAAIKLNTSELKENNKALSEVQKTAAAADGSYEKLYTEWKLADAQLKKLTGTMKIHEDGFVELTDEYIEAKKRVDNLKVGLDKFGEGIHNNKLNVGNYRESMMAAFSGVTKFSEILPAAKNGILGLNSAMKANPVGLVATLIASVLIPAMKNMEGTMKIITVITDGMSKVLSVLLKPIEWVTNALVSLFNIKDAAKDGANNVKTYAEVIGKEIDILNEKIQDKQNDRKRIFDDESKSLEERTKAVYEYYDALIYLAQAKVNSLYDKDIEELQKKEQELKDFNLLGIDRKDLEEDIKVLKEKNNEKVSEFEKANNVLLTLETERDDKLSGINKKSIDEANKLNQQRFDAIKKANDLILDENLKFNQKLTEQEYNALNERIENEKLLAEQSEAEKKELQDQTRADNLNAELLNIDAQIQADELAKQQKIKNIQDVGMVMAASANVIGGIADLMDAKTEESAKWKKNLALAEIGVSAGSAVAKGIAESQNVGFPANIAAMLVTVASVLGGIAKAKSLVNQSNIPKKGSSGGGSGGSLGGITGASAGSGARSSAISSSLVSNQIKNMPQPIVTVEDINAAQSSRVKVTNKAQL